MTARKALLFLSGPTVMTVCVVALMWVTLLTPAKATLPLHGTRAQAVDLGSASAIEGAVPVTITVALKLRNPDAMQALLESIYTRGSAQYHQFLSTDQFKTQFGPSAETIAEVSRHFRAAGFQVAQTSTAHLSVTGGLAALEKEFGVSLHAYEMPAIAGNPGYRFHAPVGKPQISNAISDAVQAVVGLDTRPHALPQVMKSPLLSSHKSAAKPASTGSDLSDLFGILTVRDFAKYYDVDPLYDHGLNGAGKTIGIVTFASFTPSDAFAYWNAVGLTVSPNRITEIQIDGGAGAPSDAAGSVETTLDVEQSGGLAPGARIRVYEAPNTNQGTVDAYAAVIDANRADTISSSWISWDYEDQLDTPSGGAATNPNTGKPSTVFLTLNDLFAQAALQGQSLYIATGDWGAFISDIYYDVPSWPPPPESIVLSVGDPAVQQWATAMGGTTLAGSITLAVSATQNLTINIPKEQAWGWDYLIPFCADIGYNPLSCGIFSTGSTGGISPFMPLPFYQRGITGILDTAPGQRLLDYSQTPPAPVVTLPAKFRGRNVPDLSLNSDPETGYVIYYTSSATGFGLFDFYGGTSFAAPQINGVTAVFDEAYGRVGLLNFALYDLVRRGVAYGGPNAPLRDISAGDNWHF
ncbi:MAG: S53 family serine peptidase, partial [Burkholderiaceae bacterium]